MEGCASGFEKSGTNNKMNIEQEPAPYSEGRLLSYFTGISGICNIEKGFRYAMVERVP